MHRFFTGAAVGGEARMIRAIDLCAGGGGWACAARNLPIQIVLAVDHWEAAVKTYQLNQPNWEVWCEDLREASVQMRVRDFARANSVDLILGGIPCEWVSVYRKLTKVKPAELAMQRATLDSVLRLVGWINPRWWCLEDVKAILGQLPPLIPYTEINSRHYSAQRRKRVYLGCFPRPIDGECDDTLSVALRRGPYRIGRRTFGRTAQTSRIFDRTTTLGAYADRKAPTVCNVDSRRDAELALVDGSLPGGLRQLEWQEMAALQGFPDDYLFYGSPRDVGLMIARAVQIDTARAILRAIVADEAMSLAAAAAGLEIR